MTHFDIVIISDAKDVIKRDMTQACIDSIFNTQDKGYFFKIIVVEANKLVKYDDCLTLHYDFEFNYNRCLNFGLKHSMATYKGVCNNDLIFHYGWAAELKKAFDLGFGSVSPYCLKTHKMLYPVGKHIYSGYKIGYHVSGWAIFFTDSTLKAIGSLNENVSFWYSDNIYAEQIKYAGVKHALVCSSFVTHLGSSTLKDITNLNMRRTLTSYQSKIFEKEKIKVWKGVKEDVYTIKQAESNRVAILKK